VAVAMGALLSQLFSSLIDFFTLHGRLWSRRSVLQQKQALIRHPKQLYVDKALHGELFDESKVETWFRPDFLSAIAGWRQSGDAKDIDLLQLPGVRLEAPGVVSFDCLTPLFCARLLEEAQNYRTSGLPQRAPNSMNNYGVVLADLGLKTSFSTALRDFLLGVGSRLFGHDSIRATHLGQEFLSTDNWGGCSLDDHYSFIVRYDPDEDRDLDMHVDDCDVTFNFGLSDSTDYAGSDLAFCGMRGSAVHRKLVHTYSHARGRCVVHSGKQRHGALPIQHGSRSSLIMWTRSESYRCEHEYQLKCYCPSEREVESPDLICLSRTHDWDYERVLAKHSGLVASKEVTQPPPHKSVSTDGVPMLPIGKRRS